RYGERKFAFETRGKATVRVYSLPFSRDYHRILNGMVEAQLRASIKMTGDFWFTAWVDAGQPDINRLIDYRPTEEALKENRAALENWKAARFNARAHEED